LPACAISYEGMRFSVSIFTLHAQGLLDAQRHVSVIGLLCR